MPGRVGGVSWELVDVLLARGGDPGGLDLVCVGVSGGEVHRPQVGAAAGSGGSLRPVGRARASASSEGLGCWRGARGAAGTDQPAGPPGIAGQLV